MEALFLYEIVRVAVSSGILVSIVVSIPACHAGDPPGREALFFALCSLLFAFCSLLFALCSFLFALCFLLSDLVFLCFHSGVCFLFRSLLSVLVFALCSLLLMPTPRVVLYASR